MKIGLYRFDDCVVDRDARELRRDGTLLVLPPKVFDALVYLIEHRDRAVGRDELISAVWGKVDVSDTLLSQTVLRARRAIGDKGTEQSAIRTVPRFGYRWVATIAEESPDAIVATEAARDAEPDPPLRAIEPVSAPVPRPIVDRWTRPRRWRAAPVVLACALLLVAGAGLYWMGTAADPPPPQTAARPAATEPALLVLPVDVDAGADWAWLRLGLMELIASRVRASGQSVVPNDTIVALVRSQGDRTPIDGKALLDATGAPSLMAASASLDDGEWRVRVSLHDTQGVRREAQARGADVIATAREASDRLLALMGRPMPSALDLSSGEVLSRVEAALLTNRIDQARETLDQAPAGVRDSAEARLQRARIDFLSGDRAGALRRLEALRGEVNAESDPLLMARIANGAGTVHLSLDEGVEAERDFNLAISLVEKLHQPAVLGQAYSGRAISQVLQNRMDVAVVDFAHARVALEMAGDALGLARVEANEGILDAKRGRYAQAVATSLRAAGRFERLGAINERVSTLANVGQAQLALLQAGDALATSDRAWPLLGNLESPFARDAIRVERAAALAEVGRVAEARALLRELLGAASASPPMLLARARIVMARLDLADGHFAAAAANSRAAVDALENPDYSRDRAFGWLLLTRALRASGDEAGAATEVARLDDWAASALTAGPAAHAQLAKAEQQWTGRGSDDAIRAFDEAAAIAERSAVPADLADVQVSFGERLIDSGRFARATAVVGQVSRWSDHDFTCALLRVRLYHAIGERSAWQSALNVARGLAGERTIPAALASPPGVLGASASASPSGVANLHGRSSQW